MSKGLYEKYRVFKEPETAWTHPVPLSCFWIDERFSDGPQDLEEVDTFVFVLKPDTDQHARVALSAYAESIRPFNPAMAADLQLVLEDLHANEVRASWDPS